MFCCLTQTVSSRSWLALTVVHSLVYLKYTPLYVIASPHVLFHSCRFLLSPVLYGTLIAQLLKCFGCGLNGCGWIPVSNINFQNILCTYYHSLSTLPWVISPWGDHAKHDWTVRPVKIRPANCLETLGASHLVVRCDIPEDLESSAIPMRMCKTSQEAALKNMSLHPSSWNVLMTWPQSVQ